MDDKRVIDLAHECELFDGQHYGSLWADRILLFAVAIEVMAEQREREACAKLAQETVCDVHTPTGIKIYGTKAAQAIRARGES